MPRPIPPLPWLFALVLAASPALARAQDAEPTPDAIRRALARYAREPTVDEVVAAALAHDPSSPEAARRAALRARRAAWLPLLRLAGRHVQQRDRTDYLDQDDPRTNLGADQDVQLEARMDFHLGRLVYAPDEAAWGRELRAREADRRVRVRQVIELYFERRRLQLERDLLGVTDVARAVRIAEIEAILNARTGGEFGRRLREAARAG